MPDEIEIVIQVDIHQNKWIYVSVPPSHPLYRVDEAEEIEVPAFIRYWVASTGATTPHRLSDLNFLDAEKGEARIHFSGTLGSGRGNWCFGIPLDNADHEEEVAKNLKQLMEIWQKEESK